MATCPRAVVLIGAGSLALLLQIRPALGQDKASATVSTKHSPSVKRDGVATGFIVSGNVTQLFARASDSRAPAPGSSQVVLPGSGPPLPYNIGTGTKPVPGGPYTTGPVSVTGTSYIPQANATIDIYGATPTKMLPWASTPLARIAEVTPPPASPPPAETAHAVAKITDPQLIGGVQAGDQVTFSLTIGAGPSLTIDPHPGVNELLSASLSGSDQTDLNGIGTLWDWSWTADSLHPGLSSFTFASNPVLGLNDSLIDSEFNSIVSYDPSAGTFGLTSAFDVDTTITITGDQTSFHYGGSGEADAASSVAPEPSSFVMLAAGALGMLGCAWWTSRARSTDPAK
jgi:hypothetical protein